MRQKIVSIVIVSMFISANFFTHAHAADRYETANLYPDLWAASSGQDLDEVKRIVAKGADVNRRDASGSTALLHAAMAGNQDIVKFLISKGAEINIRERSMGLSPISAAAANGHEAIVKLLIEAGATDIDGAISAAKRFGYKEIEVLLHAEK
jgi:ankyrin repeat protein